MPGSPALTADVFLDTNILLYAAMAGRADPAKKARARAIVLEEDYATSAQVLAEFFVNATRKGERPMSLETAREWVRQLARKPCVPLTPDLVTAGADLAQRFQLAYWDAAILAAAQRVGAKTLYTEDLSHGQSYGPVTAINPFLSA